MDEFTRLMRNASDLAAKGASINEVMQAVQDMWDHVDPNNHILQGVVFHTSKLFNMANWMYTEQEAPYRFDTDSAVKVVTKNFRDAGLVVG